MMFRWGVFGAVIGLFSLATAFIPSSLAHKAPDHPQLPNFDRRLARGPQPGLDALPAQIAPRAGSLTNRNLRSTGQERRQRFERHDRVLSLRHIYAQDPPRPSAAINLGTTVRAQAGVARPQGGGAPSEEASSPLPGRGTNAVRNTIAAFLAEHGELLGHGSEILDSMRVMRSSVSESQPWQTLALQQVVSGLEVYEGVLLGHVDQNGEVVSVSSQVLTDFVPGPVTPRLTVAQAVVRAAQAVEEPVATEPVVHPEDAHRLPATSGERVRFRAAPLPGDIYARLIWLPISPHEAILAWEIELVRRLAGELYRVVIDAETGEVLIRLCRTYYAAEATYRVFTSDSPSPFSPAHEFPSTNQPPRVERELVTISALSTNASPTGWIHPQDNEIRGNNVEAHLDRNGDNQPDVPRPQGHPFRVFDFPLDLDGSPVDHGPASAVQLFYWCNWAHDRLYDLGWTEAAGNLQKDNFGRGGLDNDVLIADAQDGSGFNNANYAPRPDGISPRIQMFIFDGPDPNRDGDLDADIVLHEYAHGLTDRLVGGGIGITALQTLGMGEGWSDFYALTLLSEAGDDLAGTYPEGGYSTFHFLGLRQNYYFGIRRFPYSTDMTKNPLTFKDIDPAQIDAHQAIPRNPILPFDPQRASFVHRQGEVWCAALWEIRANLIEKHGFETGNELTLQLVTDGLKLSPPNPTFLQARDAILLADRIRQGGDNQVELWRGFAKRGMGVDATSPSSDTTDGVVESFAVPDTLTALPQSTQHFSGPAGGPYAPSCRVLQISNPSSNTVSWTATHLLPWLDLFPGEGTVAPGDSMNLVVCLNEQALALPPGFATDLITISNRNTGALISRLMQVRTLVPAEVPLHEDFESGVLGASWSAIDSALGRTAVTTAAGPYEGVYHLTMTAQESGVPADSQATLMVDLAGYTSVTLEFAARQYNDEPLAPTSVQLEDTNRFDGIAISDDGIHWYEVRGLRDLENYYATYTVSLDEVAQRHGLVYHDHFRIRFLHHGDDLIPNDGLGLDDIRIRGLAPRRLVLSLPESVSEQSGGADVTGTLQLPVPAEASFNVELFSSDDGELSVPSSVHFPAGSTQAVFTARVIDDDLLDGPQPVIVLAQAPGYLGDQTEVEVTDNETARLIISMPARVREGQGTLLQGGLLVVDRAPQSDIRVSLSSPDTTEIIVPTQVILPADALFVSFDIQVVDDVEIDGDQPLLISANVEGWTGDQDIVTVEDNEHRNLSITAPSLLQENSELLPNVGAVSISGTLTNDLIVTLASTRPERVRPPERVTLAAGETRATFSITLTDDNVAQGKTTLTLSAEAPEFTTAQIVMSLLDDEQPPQPLAPVPPHLSTNVPLQTTLGWSMGVPELLVNGGFESGSLAGWFAATSLNGSFVINDGSFDPLGPEPPTPPYEGQYSVVSQQVGPGRQELVQDLPLPLFTQAIKLAWTQRIRNHADSFASNQLFRVEIRNAANQILAVPFTTNPGDPLLQPWRELNFDLSPWRGQRVRVAFVEIDELGFMNVHLDAVQVFLDYRKPAFSEVYFGTDPALGPETLLGTTTNRHWVLPPLAPEQDYYWQVVARRNSLRLPGPVWTFQTRGQGELHHFTWNAIESPQERLVPFPVRLTARDDLGNVVSNFFGAVRFDAFRQAAVEPVQLLTYIEYADTFRQTRRTQGAITSHFTNVVNSTFDQSDPSLLATALQGKDVFLIMAQRFADGNTLRELGQTWQPVLEGFVADGGVVIVNSYQRDEHEIVNQSGLLPVTKVRSDPSLTVTTHPDPELTSGLPAQFTAYNVATYEPPGAGSALLTGASNQVVGAARRLGDGLVVLLGTDFATNRTAMDQLLAQAVGWPQRDARQSIDIFPRQSGFFVEGQWEGTMQFQEVADAVWLTASNAQASSGLVGPIRVTATNDLNLTVLDSPDPARVGDLVTFQLTVTRSGPESALQVVVTNLLSPGLQYVSSQSDQGQCQFTNGVLTCNLGTMAPGDGANITLLTRPVSAGTVTNRFHVVSDTPESYLANNEVQAITRITFPNLATSTVRVNEPDQGQVHAEFVLSLFPANDLEVRCRVRTEDDSARAGEDYLPVQQTVVFPPGVTNQIVRVPILGDTLHEGNELVRLRLDAPERVSILTPQATIIIADNDPAPVAQIQGNSIVEGPPDEQSLLTFPITLSAPSGRDIEISFATAEATATAEQDYLDTASSLRLLAGETTAAIDITVLGDDIAESNETFHVVLTAAQGVTLATNLVVGTILDDDAASLQSYAWEEIASPQFLERPFNVRITARDSLGDLFTGPVGDVFLDAYSAQQQILVTGAGGSWEFPMGTGFHDQRLQSIYLPDEIGGPSRLTALALQVTALPGQRLGSWTIRLKHYKENSYTNPAWESEGWSTVFQQQLQSITRTGWIRFDFQTPFIYNGTDALLVDFSFDNASFSRNGLCAFLTTETDRSIHFRTDGAFGPPTQWAGSTAPPPQVARRVPQLQIQSEQAVAIVPQQTGPWSQGEWSGEITVLETASSVTLRARDAQNHSGTANDFAVSALDDLALRVVVQPEPVLFDGPVTYTLAITNTGPSTATQVVVTNQLPDDLLFTSVETSRGDCDHQNGLITCRLGTLAPNTEEIVAILALSQSTGLLTNHAGVVRAEAESFTANNRVSTVSRAQPPSLSVNDLLLTEGDAGTQPAVFNVRLSNATELPVSVEYASVGLTATNAHDFIQTNGLLHFMPGETNHQVTVHVRGDLRQEIDETFTVELFNPTNAVLGKPVGTATILDEDPLPELTLEDVSVMEGNSGQFFASANVVLSQASGRVVWVDYATGAGTATPQVDYTPRSGRLLFPPGLTNRLILIGIFGDTDIEEDETIPILLSGPEASVLVRSNATMTIVNDDGLPGRFDHFSWSTIQPTQWVNQPFYVVLEARDFYDNPVADYDGFADLTAREGADDVVLGGDDTAWFMPLGSSYHDARAQMIYLADDLPAAATLRGLALNVVLTPLQTLHRFTIRLKHTPLSRYAFGTWETNGWTVVYHQDLEMDQAGWITLPFATPFTLNGTDNLMVDMSFNNTYYTLDGFVEAGSTNASRAIYQQSDSEHGDPLHWFGSNNPFPVGASALPNLRFLTGRDLPMEPSYPVAMADGRWDGFVTLLESSPQVRLRAEGDLGNFGFSAPFTVLENPDLDNDGLPDAWEILYFGSIDHPESDPDSDPDQDGATNREEWLAGTLPLDSTSVLALVGITVAGQDVVLQFPSHPDRFYVVEFTGNLNDRQWKTLGQPQRGTGNILVQVDVGTATLGPRFYRVMAYR